MAMKSGPLPLHQRVSHPNTMERVFLSILSVLIFCLLLYRLAVLPGLSGVAFGLWLAAFLCESWFAFIWVLSLNMKWHFIENKAFPDRLLHRLKTSQDFPAIDVFITTADPTMEPPIITVNTVLSVLAVEYPVDKIACYVSDDGCSLITFYSLMEASKFARLWVPFCRKYGVEIRAPFLYFCQTQHHPHNSTLDFDEEWKELKRAYEELAKKISEAGRKSIPDEFSGDNFSAFAKIERRNHPTVLKVIIEHRGQQEDEVPHLIYVSREKRPSHSHHFKAGAMNVLTRVSGVMTNATFMLNLDCDMFVNNPKVMHHALCLLLGFESEAQSGFVQFPQMFHGGLKDDPYGNQFKVLVKHLLHGTAAHQGPMYGGTGCFHRRRAIYGHPPSHNQEAKDGRYFKLANGWQSGRSREETLAATFGCSEAFIESAVEAALGGNAFNTDPHPLKPTSLSTCLEAAISVSACDYEDNTHWGTQVGWVYGSTAEDVMTGCRIHSSGWNSVACCPDPPAFLGSAPSNGPDTLVQQKRWATGLLEILISHRSPLRAVAKEKLQLRQCMVYLSVLLWAVRSVPEFCYAILPAFCIITNRSIFPKIGDPVFRLPAAIFIVFNLYTLLEYLVCGLSVREWWNNQRGARIFSSTAWLFGLIAVLMKSLGISETVFELTRKDDSESAPPKKEAGRFIFDSSTIYVPATALLFVNMAALFLGLSKVIMEGEGAADVGELLCCVWVAASFLPFLKGLFRRGSYGIPSSTLCKSGALASLFVCLCRCFLD